MRLTHWPATPAARDLEGLQTVRVYRRTDTGQRSGLGTPLNQQWLEVAAIAGSIHPKSGVLRMLAPGLSSIASHQLLTRYQEDADGRYVVRPKDVIVDRFGQPYLVTFVADLDGAQLTLAAELTSGAVNPIPDWRDQG